jgi:hypothetical protein
MEKKPHPFCETPEENCTMNYCDDNGCQNRNRELVNPLDNLTPDEMVIGGMNSELTQLKAENERLKGELKTDYITIFRETAMRANLAFPLDEQELNWFDEGMTKDFCIKLVHSLDKARPNH